MNGIIRALISVRIGYFIWFTTMRAGKYSGKKYVVLDMEVME